MFREVRGVVFFLVLNVWVGWYDLRLLRGLEFKGFLLKSFRIFLELFG